MSIRQLAERHPPIERLKWGLPPDNCRDPSLEVTFILCVL